MNKIFVIVFVLSCFFIGFFIGERVMNKPPEQEQPTGITETGCPVFLDIELYSGVYQDFPCVRIKCSEGEEITKECLQRITGVNDGN